MSCPVCGKPSSLLGVHHTPGIVAGAPVYDFCSRVCAVRHNSIVAANQQRQDERNRRLVENQREAEAGFEENLRRLVSYAALLHTRRPALFKPRVHVWFYEPLLGRGRPVQCELAPAVPVGEHLWTVRKHGERRTGYFSTGVTAAGEIVLMVDSPRPDLRRRSCNAATHQRWRSHQSGGDARLGDGTPAPPSSPYLSFPHRTGPEVVVAGAVNALAAEVANIQPG